MQIKRHFSYIVLLIALSISGCKENGYELIPRDKFVDILVDLHQTDAILSQKGFSGLALFDSVPAYYAFVLDKYDISRESFDKSLIYYNHDLSIMLSIYDDVIIRLKNKMPKKIDEKSIYRFLDIALEEAKIKTNPDKWFGNDGKELWTKTTNLSISTKDTASKADFKVTVKHHSLFMLKANVNVFNDDSSKNLRMFLKINYRDTTSDLVEKPFTENDGGWKYYQLFLRTDSTKRPESVECMIFDFDTLVGKRHVMANNISLRQFSLNRDTLDLVIKKETRKTNLKPPKKAPVKKKSGLKQINISLHQD